MRDSAAISFGVADARAGDDRACRARDLFASSCEQRSEGRNHLVGAGIGFAVRARVTDLGAWRGVAVRVGCGWIAPRHGRTRHRCAAARQARRTRVADIGKHACLGQQLVGHVVNLVEVGGDVPVEQLEHDQLGADVGLDPGGDVTQRVSDGGRRERAGVGLDAAAAQRRTEALGQRKQGAVVAQVGFGHHAGDGEVFLQGLVLDQRQGCRPQT
ncbi:MAG: hypothetical protein LKM39_02895 [Chiayiivirga sp.]|jgi:hypothetical protein|nr:hypothetical protein [Chiayiivirga sp.]